MTRCPRCGLVHAPPSSSLTDIDDGHEPGELPERLGCVRVEPAGPVEPVGQKQPRDDAGLLERAERVRKR